jgi:hypothetical protein
MDRFGKTHQDLIKDDLTAASASLADGTLHDCPICGREVIQAATLKSYLSKGTEALFMRHIHQHGF